MEPMPSVSTRTRSPWKPRRIGRDALGPNDVADTPGWWTYRVEGWSDPYATWVHDAEIKIGAGVDEELMCAEGVKVLDRFAAAVTGQGIDAAAIESARAALADTSRPPAARLAVAANTAQGYLQLRALQGQRALLVEGIEVARELERIAGLLFHAGEVTRLDVGMRPPEGSTLEEMSAHFENQGRLDVLMDALGRWPSTQVVDAAIRAAKEHGVTRVEVRLPPNAEDE